MPFWDMKNRNFSFVMEKHFCNHFLWQSMDCKHDSELLNSVCRCDRFVCISTWNMHSQKSVCKVKVKWLHICDSHSHRWRGATTGADRDSWHAVHFLTSFAIAVHLYEASRIMRVSSVCLLWDVFYAVHPKWSVFLEAEQWYVIPREHICRGYSVHSFC